MKHISYLLCALALAALTSTAVAKVSWQGEVMVTAVSGAACAANGDAVGDQYLGLLLPKGLGNGPNSFLTFLSRRNAFGMKVAGGLANGKAYSSVFISGRGEFGSSPAGKIQTITISPNPLTATTDVVSVVATITNWQTDVGCTATIHGAFVLRRN